LLSLCLPDKVRIYPDTAIHERGIGVDSHRTQYEARRRLAPAPSSWVAERSECHRSLRRFHL